MPEVWGVLQAGRPVVPLIVKGRHEGQPIRSFPMKISRAPLERPRRAIHMTRPLLCILHWDEIAKKADKDRSPFMPIWSSTQTL